MVHQYAIHLHKREACRRCRFNPRVRKIPWRRKWQLQYSYLENPIDREAYSPESWGHNESDKTE